MTTINPNTQYLQAMERINTLEQNYANAQKALAGASSKVSNSTKKRSEII
jgi:hypothetical protein